MTTMAQAVRAYVESAGKVTADQIKRHINSQFPGQWKASTLQAHLYACVANNPKAYIHHPSAEKFLYRNSDGIGRRWLLGGPRAEVRANAPFQTVRADFPHTAYQWLVGVQHYAVSCCQKACTG
jgi:hypothetical protein